MAMNMRPRPSILHLLSDWKWTGPAEPIVNLCRHLRRHGHVVDLACTRPPHDYPSSIAHHANARRVEPILDFNLNKRFNLFENLHDLAKLTEFIDREEVQILHVHSSHDHYIGSRAARRSNNQPFVVRTNHTGVPIKPTMAMRWLIKGHTSGWVALSEACRDADAKNFDIDPAYAVAVEGTVDLERFNTTNPYGEARPEIGFAPEHVVACTVARAQKHRRFDILLAALANAMKEEPSLRAMLIGRGTHFDELVREPVRQLGLANKIVLPGYLTDNYADYLAGSDFMVFLVPGSDGSCRAVREAMALGKPIVASRRGILAELVEHGKCGLVVDDDIQSLAQAILAMARDREMRRRMGDAAAEKARALFNIDRQVETIADLYMRLAEQR